MKCFVYNYQKGIKMIKFLIKKSTHLFLFLLTTVMTLLMIVINLIIVLSVIGTIVEYVNPTEHYHDQVCNCP